MKRILIEFFDTENLNNCISQLHESFDRVIYLYFKNQKNVQTEPLFAALSVFNRSRAGVEPEFIPVEKRDVDSVIQTISGLVNDSDEFRFDITGGPELFIIAAGIFYGSYTGKNISVRQYSVKTGRAIVSYPPESPDAEKNYILSVKEMIALHGSAIEDGLIKRNLKKGNIRDDLVRFWYAVQKQSITWNKFCCLPNKTKENSDAFYKQTVSEDEKNIFNSVTGKLKEKDLITIQPDEIIGGVHYSSFISKMSPDADFLFEKGGNILEMISYLAVKEANPDADVLVSVPVDWDGVILGEDGETRNEIDLIVSDGRTSIFISCKNTDVTNNFLYEIQSVASHYGGRYAKCVLISTVKNREAIRKRAKAMGVELIDDIGSVKYEKFRRQIKEACFPEIAE